MAGRSVDVRYECSGSGIELFEELTTGATRLALESFSAPTGPVGLRVRRWDGSGDDALAFDGNLGDGRFRINADELQVAFATGPSGVEAVLRLAWDIVTERLGGVMLHASAVAIGDRALVVTGQSGTGKTTIARHAAAAGATLLSDEIVQILPGGVCVGTPFRSDQRLSGTPTRARMLALTTIVKAQVERLDEWSPADAMATARAQVFRRPGVAVGPLTRRLMSLLGDVRCLRLSCRDHADAGRFVVDWLSHGR